MRNKGVLRALFGALAVLVVVGGIALTQKNLRARDQEASTPGFFNAEYFLMGGGRLGVQLEDVTSENMGQYHLNQETGVIVKRVEKDSPAEKAGLQANDVILNYAGVPVFSTSQLGRMVRETPANRKVSVDILRGGSQQTLPIKIGEPTGFSGFGTIGIPENLEKMAPAIAESRRLLKRRGTWLGRPRLGVGLEDLTDQMAAYFGVKEGALITSVREDSAAAKAGLRAGDIITAIDNKNVRDVSDVMHFLGDKEEGGPMTLTVVRDKRTLSVTVNLEKVEKSERRPARRERGIRL